MFSVGTLSLTCILAALAYHFLWGRLEGSFFKKLGTTLTILISIYVIGLTWNPVHTFLLASITGSASTARYLAVLVYMVVICAGLGTAWWLANNDSLTGNYLAKHGTMRAWLAAVLITLGAYFLVGISGYTMGYTMDWRMYANIFLTAYFVVGGTYFVKNWYPHNQDNWAIPFSYAICTIAIGYLGEMIGISFLDNITESPRRLSIYFGLNLFIFWLCYVISRKSEKMERRFSYWLLKPLCIVLCLLFLAQLTLQLGGWYSHQEGITVMLSNIAGKRVEDLSRNQALEGLEDARKTLEAAIAANNLSAAQAAEKDIQGFQKKQEDIIPYQKTYPKVYRQIAAWWVADDKPAQASQLPQTRRQVFSKVLKPHEMYIVAQVKNGDTLRFLTFNGPVFSQIDDGIANRDWDQETGTTLQYIRRDGQLRVRAGDQTVHFTLEVTSK